MRQINVTLDTHVSSMQPDDYFLIEDVHGHKVAVIYASVDNSGHVCFYAASAWTHFSGCNELRYQTRDYPYNWVLGKRVTTVEDMIQYIMAEKDLNRADWCLSGTTADQSTARATTAAPESNVFVNKNYADTTMYTGVKSYHSHHDDEPNKTLKHHSGYKVGVELEVECNNSESHRKCTEIQSNWIYMETDGSLSSRGIEFITIPLRPQDAKKAETWSALITYLSKHAKSWSKSSCGLHVHIGREILGRTAEQQSETISKMLFLYHHWLKDCSMNRAIYGRMRGYSDQDAKAAEADAARTLGKEVFKSKKLKDTVKKALIAKSSRGRYFDINLSNSATIEFRRGRGSINTARITAVVEYCELICLYAKQAKWENISEADFVAYCRKKIAPTSPLARWITSEEACE